MDNNLENNLTGNNLTENNQTDNNQLHSSIIYLFNKHYPDLNPIEIDKELFVDMMTNIIALEQAKIDKQEEEQQFENNIIKQNYLMANEIIPEMFVSNELIYLKGKLNKTDINILVDSGCQTSTVFKTTTDKANLEYIIDKKSTTICHGVGGLTKTYGMLWFTELEIETEPNKFVTIPIKLSVVDDTKKNELEKELDNFKLAEDEYIEQNESSEKKLDLLLGIDFMKSYKAVINFNKKTITLNDSIVINYN